MSSSPSSSITSSAAESCPLPPSISTRSGMAAQPSCAGRWVSSSSLTSPFSADLNCPRQTCRAAARRLKRRRSTSRILSKSSTPSTVFILNRRYWERLGWPSSKDHHAGHGVAALDVGNVVALHPVQRQRQGELFLQLLGGLLDDVLVVQPLDAVLGQALSGVVCHGFHQLLVHAALRPDKAHRPASRSPRSHPVTSSWSSTGCWVTIRGGMVRAEP